MKEILTNSISFNAYIMSNFQSRSPTQLLYLHIQFKSSSDPDSHYVLISYEISVNDLRFSKVLFLL